ncbi:hypothetical protein pdam_00024870, partial [Pocillopora damicornis]
MQGYKIPFLQLPTPFAKRSNTSARENISARGSRKQRLVLNLRYVNRPVYFHIDFEAIAEIVEEPGHPCSYFPRR